MQLVLPETDFMELPHGIGLQMLITIMTMLSSRSEILTVMVLLICVISSMILTALTWVESWADVAAPAGVPLLVIICLEDGLPTV
jgi:hypothetical protein